MADGSVTIAAVLDTAAFQQSIGILESQLAGLAGRMQAAVTAAVAASGIDGAMNSIAASMTGALESLVALAASTAGQAAAAATLQFSSGDWGGTGSRAAGTLAAGFSAGTARITSDAHAAAAAARGAFTGDWSGIGSAMMAGIASGIRASAGSVISAVSDVSSQVMASTKQFYKIQSPSALMRDEVGVMLSRGIAEGILSGASYINSALGTVTAMPAFPANGTGTRAVTQNIYMAKTAPTPYQTARAMRKQSEAMLRG